MRTHLGPKIYVEDNEARTVVVSWPGGHKRVRRDELLATLATAVEDTYHPKPVVRTYLLK
jgi:hypothetical protein